MSRNCWPNAASRSITSPSTGGCNGLRPLFADAARFARHSPGDRWFVDETYLKVNGVWRYVYRAVDQHGQVIDVLVSKRRDQRAARLFFHRALTRLKVTPTEVVTGITCDRPAHRELTNLRDRPCRSKSAVQREGVPGRRSTLEPLPTSVVILVGGWLQQFLPVHRGSSTSGPSW